MKTRIIHHPTTWYCWGGRVREILLDAPWSSFDLAMSAILILRAGYLLLFGAAIQAKHPMLYAQLANTITLEGYGVLCLIAGSYGMAIVLWPTRPSYGLRLFARMGVAFVFVQYSINQWALTYPTIGAITHLVLAALAVWSLLRTQRGGR